MRVGVVGASGRMGTAICAAVAAADGLELTAEVGSGDSLEALSGCDVVVDVTRPDVVLDTVRWCIRNEVHVVVGTSGMDGARLAEVRSLLGGAPAVGVLVAPNFSLGAVLAMRFAAEAARYFESVEIVETHHPEKVDAPSGTARRTAELVSEARSAAGSGPIADATTHDPDGARGARIAGVPVHARRVRGVTAAQEVLFGSAGETLSISHETSGRDAYMPGVLLAVRAVPSLPGVTVGLESVLGLD
jgi:4-hydroxy-tetrahydrodipicolinate reductase